MIYASAGTLMVVFVFGQKLMGLNFNQLRREADFRFSLVRVRENAESIAFYRGEAQELKQVQRRFGKAFDNFNRLIRNQLALNLFQHAYSLLTLVIPSAIIASRVLSGELEVGRAVQAAGSFAAVLSAISLIVENFEGLSRFAAGVDRLDTLAKVLPEQSGSQAQGKSTIESVDGADITLASVTLHTPNYDRILVKDLSVTVKPGEGLMIVGESGSGKSSLLRAIAGLWRSGTGTIYRPPEDEILFLPQQPYMLLGTLRSQLLYPNHGPSVSDAELMDLLQRVNLPDLAARFGGLDVEMDWHKVLSVGEQQRLAFARLLLTKPRSPSSMRRPVRWTASTRQASTGNWRKRYNPDQRRPPFDHPEVPQTGSGTHRGQRLAGPPGGEFPFQPLSRVPFRREPGGQSL